MHNKESDICLIVKDLQKGWKENHEPTTQHYQELLSSKGVDFINEVKYHIGILRILELFYLPLSSLDHTSAAVARRVQTL